MTTRHKFLHKSMLQALLELSNPKMSVCRPLVKGKAAGKMDLIYQLYPPRELPRNSIPATYTFVLEDYVTEEIGLMVSMVDTGDGGEGMIFGFIAHDCWDELSHRAKSDQPESLHHYVVVKYNPVIREGFIYFYKDAYALIERANGSRLESCRQLNQETQKISSSTPSAKLTLSVKSPDQAEKPRILYAEDNTSLRETITSRLERRGYVVDAVEDGRDVINKLDASVVSGRHYNLVITDNDMPRVTGLEVLRRLSVDSRFYNLPIIVFSGSNIKSAVEEAGGVYFGKDGKLDEFDSLVKKTLTRTTIKQ